MKVVVVIPVYNEAASVGAQVAAVRQVCQQVVVVDDGSSDDSARQAHVAGAVVLRHIINRGYGAALITGTDFAFRQGADIVVHFDADGQFVASEIPQLLAPLWQAGADISLGSRFLGQAINISWWRYLTLKLATYFTWAISGIKLSDAHNGFRAISRSAWREMNLQQSRMAFSSEIINEMARLKLKFSEVPVTVYYTSYSRTSSKQGKWPALKIIKDIFWGKFLS